MPGLLWFVPAVAILVGATGCLHDAIQSCESTHNQFSQLGGSWTGDARAGSYRLVRRTSAIHDGLSFGCTSIESRRRSLPQNQIPTRSRNPGWTTLGSLDDC